MALRVKPVSAKESRFPCLWMQAGVVRKRFCPTDYDCRECSFDRALRRAAEENGSLRSAGTPPPGRRGRIRHWEDELRERPPGRRPCIHHMTGRIEFRPCTHDYQCHDCDFDQYYDDQYKVHVLINPVDVMKIRGFRVPQGYYLHTGHAWMRLEGDGMVRIGIDDFAHRLLGPLERIEAPLTGKKVKQGQTDMTLIRGMNTAEVCSPISGVVTAVNGKLMDGGTHSGLDPYSEGWIIMVYASHLSNELHTLMINDETGKYMKGEAEALYGMIEEIMGPLAADGGEPSHDIFGSLPELGWNRLCKHFLRT